MNDLTEMEKKVLDVLDKDTDGLGLLSLYNEAVEVVDALDSLIEKGLVKVGVK